LPLSREPKLASTHMSTTAKALQILQLFKRGASHLSAAQVVSEYKLSPATAYRYLADLEAAGLIERAGAANYVLGSEIIELDRHIRLHDPMIAAASDVMKNLAERTGATVLLCRLHQRKVVCVHQHAGRHAPPSDAGGVSYERGRAMPLFRGAPSRVILARMSKSALRELIAHDAPALRQAGLPTRFDALWAALESARNEKVSHSIAEVDAGALGWAAPISQNGQLASLSAVLWSQAPAALTERIADQVLRAALRIEGRLDSA
jgi:DNA-binding IclR family transcriptional regulator